jgi:hypothetical protein
MPLALALWRRTRAPFSAIAVDRETRLAQPPDLLAEGLR